MMTRKCYAFRLHFEHFAFCVSSQVCCGEQKVQPCLAVFQASKIRFFDKFFVALFY